MFDSFLNSAAFFRCFFYRRWNVPLLHQTMNAPAPLKLVLPVKRGLPVWWKEMLSTRNHGTTTRPAVISTMTRLPCGTKLWEPELASICTYTVGMLFLLQPNPLTALLLAPISTVMSHTGDLFVGVMEGDNCFRTTCVGQINRLGFGAMRNVSVFVEEDLDYFVAVAGPRWTNGYGSFTLTVQVRVCHKIIIWYPSSVDNWSLSHALTLVSCRFRV